MVSHQWAAFLYPNFWLFGTGYAIHCAFPKPEIVHPPTNSQALPRSWLSGSLWTMLFTLLVNPLTGKDLDWADPSKHPSVPALGKAVINKCFTEVRACVCALVPWEGSPACCAHRSR